MSSLEDEFPELNKRPPEVIWEFYCKTKFGNNMHIGHIVKTNEFKATTDAEPWIIIPADKFEVVEKQIKFALAAYEQYLKTKVAAAPEV